MKEDGAVVCVGGRGPARSRLMNERVSGHGGDLVAEALRVHGVDRVFTLSGGHIFPIYDGLQQRGMRIIDTRHEQAAAFAAEAHAKLTRSPGIVALTAGPGVTNGMSALASAHFNGSPMVVLAGRAPQARWGEGSLQEIDHIPLVASIAKRAETVHDPALVAEKVASALRLSASPHRGVTFLDFPIDVIFAACEANVPGPPYEAGGATLAGDLDAASRAIESAERPVVLLGSDVWADGAEKAARTFVERAQVPAFMNGMGRGVIPADHSLAFNAARGHAMGRADLVVVVGTPLDFRLAFGKFGSAAVVHIVDNPSVLARHVTLAAGVAGSLSQALEQLSPSHAADRGGWIAELRSEEQQRRRSFGDQLSAAQTPIHPARIYGALLPLLPRDAVLIADGGDFASYAGKFVDVFEPGAWLDPGAFGCLGTAPGYALASGLLDPDRRIVVFLGDGAAGFGMGDWDTLVRFGINVTMVCGNNGIWGLEKHPMQALYGYDVAAELRPETRYDEVMRALGGHGELVREPDELDESLRRALDTPGPSLVNVITDPSIAYPRSSNLA